MGKPFSPGAVLSARTLEVLHDALHFCDAVVDAKVTDASANVFSLIEPGVVAVYSKAQTRTVPSSTVLELGNFTPLRQNIDIHAVVQAQLCNYSRSHAHFPP